MKLKYDLNDVPPYLEMFFLGLQWLVVSIPLIIIIGKIVAIIHFTDSMQQISYIQKLFFVTAISLIGQLLFGHRLPIMIGPATVLLIGIIASQGHDMGSVYTAILLGGIILFILSISGVFGYLQLLFSPRVIATILLLIAFTLLPTIMNLVLSPESSVPSVFNLIFVTIFVLTMFVANNHLKGIWKSTLIIWSIIFGSVVYFIMTSDFTILEGIKNYKFLSTDFIGINFRFSLKPGILVSFLICFLALSINDLGSIQSVGELLKPDKMQNRVKAGIAATGLSNALSGLFGTIGLVNFSWSSGFIVTTSCASRFAILPAGIGLLMLSFTPRILSLLGSIPSVIVGGVLIYIMCSQITAGLYIVYNSLKDEFKYEDGLIIGLPIMMGVLISFLPDGVLDNLPVLLKPIIGNGFVVGVVLVIIMEHLILKK